MHAKHVHKDNEVLGHTHSDAESNHNTWEYNIIKTIRILPIILTAVKRMAATQETIKSVITIE